MASGSEEGHVSTKLLQEFQKDGTFDALVLQSLGRLYSSGAVEKIESEIRQKMKSSKSFPNKVTKMTEQRQVLDLLQAELDE